MARSPGISNEYPDRGSNGPVIPANAGVTGLLVDTEWGPINEPTRILSLDDAIRKFGPYSLSSDAIHAIEQFLASGSDLYVSRLGSYADVADRSSLNGNPADTDFRDAEDVDTLNVSAKYVGLYGNEIEVSIEDNPAFSTRIALSAIATSDVVRVNNLINAVPDQIIKIEYNANPTTLAQAYASLNSLKASFNSHITVGGPFHSFPDITNEVAAADASSVSTANTLINALVTAYSGHFSDAAHIGPDDSVYSLPSSAAVTRTSAEIIEDTITLIAILTGHINLLQNSVLDPVHLAVDETNLPNKVQYTQIAAFSPRTTVGTYNTLELADTLAFDVGDASLITSMEFDLSVSIGQNVLEKFERLSMVPSLDNYVVTVVNSESGGSNYVIVSDLVSASGLGLSNPSPGEKLLDSGSSTSETIDELDIVGSELTSTGINSFNEFPEVALVAVIPSDYVRPFTADVMIPIQAWCEARQDTMAYFELDPSLDFDDTYQALLDSGLNTRFSAVYGPRVKVQERAVGASASTRFISPLGSVLGLRGKVDVSYGVHEASAGADPYGKLNVLGVEKAYTKTQRGVLNERGYNVILKQPEGVLVYGSRTNAVEPLWRMQPVSRYFMFAQRTVEAALNRTLFRQNNRDTWIESKGRLQDFFNSEWQKGALYGDTADEAYRVLVGGLDGVQTEEDRLNGNLIIEISLRVSRQAEFVIIRWFQSEAGVSVTIN